MRRNLVLALLIPTATTMGLQAQPKVISADDGWTADSKKLIRGRELPASAIVTFKKPTNGKASALVLDCPGEGIHFYSCPTGSCKPSICGDKADGVLKLSEESAHGPMKRISALFEEREPKNYVTAAARAGGSPTDALLLSDSRGIHWGPALRRILEGHYCLIVQHLGKQQAAKTFLINWDSAVDPQGITPASGLAPGGYRLEKGAVENCRADPESVPAWVVIAPEGEFKKLNGDWSRTVTSLDKLSEVSTLSTVAAARHAFMASMAEIVEQQSTKR